MATEAQEDPTAALKACVARKGLKLTKQRMRIAEVFFESPGHLSADDLLEKVRAIEPQVSLATVYRTMKLLTECDLATAHRFGDGQTRFEPSSAEEDEHHDHLICTRCDRIVEFIDARIEALQEEVAHKHGFRVTEHRLELYGLCRACQIKES